MGANVFAAKKVKLELPPLFAGDPAKLSTWIFAVEQYCDLVDINSDHDHVKLAVTHCEKDALTWWHYIVPRILMLLIALIGKTSKLKLSMLLKM